MPQVSVGKPYFEMACRLERTTHCVYTRMAEPRRLVMIKSLAQLKREAANYTWEIFYNSACA